MSSRILWATLLATTLIAGCAGQRAEEIADKNQAVRDFIEVRELESVPKIRTDNYDGWDLITSTFLIYKTRRGDYLTEFSRPCWELYDPNEIRARFDTLRGCRIAAFYTLTEAEVAELENIGDPPGNQD